MSIVAHTVKNTTYDNVIDSRHKRTLTTVDLLRVFDICTAIMKDHSNPTKIRKNGQLVMLESTNCAHHQSRLTSDTLLRCYKASNTTIAKVNNSTNAIDSRHKRTLTTVDLLRVFDICTAIMKDHSNPTKIRSN